MHGFLVKQGILYKKLSYISVKNYLNIIVDKRIFLSVVCDETFTFKNLRISCDFLASYIIVYPRVNSNLHSKVSIQYHARMHFILISKWLQNFISTKFFFLVERFKDYFNWQYDQHKRAVENLYESKIKSEHRNNLCVLSLSICGKQLFPTISLRNTRMPRGSAGRYLQYISMRF